MLPITGRDLLATFLVGAAVSTGNPMLADYGIIGILLPAALALLVAVGTGLAGGTTDRMLILFRWVAAVYIAFIFLWYEQYKLLGDGGSVMLFTTLTDFAGFHGFEKVMRIGVGSCEIIASVFILIPPLQGLGAIGALMLMSGAICFHLFTPLGVDPYGDGGALFKEACSVWVSAWIVIYWRRDQLMALARSVGVPVPVWP
jgi:hypothetical protein